MTSPGSVLLIVYAPPFNSKDGRTLAVAHGMEDAFPGLCLGWTITKEGSFVSLPKRDAWLSESSHDRFPMLCNGEEGRLVTIFGLNMPAIFAPGGRSLADIHIEMPLDTAAIKAAAHMLENVAEAAHAFWGHATPDAAAGDIAEQTQASNPAKRPSTPPPPRGLPTLRLPEDIPSPELPHRLGWMNYWSAATARAIGFPDLERDDELLSRARRTASGGWVVRLTEEPLDLDNPKHLDMILRTYERFPQIGGRSI